MVLRDIIKKNLLLEKRIAQISAKAEIVFGFDVIKTKHATERMKVSSRNLTNNRTNDMSNSELSEFVKLFTREIAEGIVSDEVNDGEPFIIKSRSWGISMVILPDNVSGSYWKLIIKTVFPESIHNSIRFGKDQIFYEK